MDNGNNGDPGTLTPPRKKIKWATKFKDVYKIDFPWISKSGVGDSHAYCTMCRCAFSIPHGGKNDISNHNGTKKHRERAVAAKSQSIQSFLVRPHDAMGTSHESRRFVYRIFSGA